jgi:hypothetical protein
VDHEDPARADGEESAYQYCGGDPVGKVDPTGLWGEGVHDNKTRDWLKWDYEDQIVKGNLGSESETDGSITHINFDGARAHPKYHGYVGAGAAYTDLFDKAVKKWKKGGSSNQKKASHIL